MPRGKYVRKPKDEVIENDNDSLDPTVIHSPMTSPRPIKAGAQPTLSFYDALRSVAMGDKATRLEWGNPDVYIIMHNTHLKIKLEDGLLHDLIVSQGDLDGLDWIVTVLRGG